MVKLTNLILLSTFAMFLFSNRANAGDLIWFGIQEVQNGQLKSADGQPPQAGHQISLRVFKKELSNLVYDNSFSYQGGYGAYGHQASLFVRLNGGSQWKEIKLKGADYFMRGPSFYWDEYEDVKLNLPSDSDRIEVWLQFNRSIPGDCYLAYDMTECPSLWPWQPGYISNKGRNFKIDVQR